MLSRAFQHPDPHLPSLYPYSTLDPFADHRTHVPSPIIGIHRRNTRDPSTYFRRPSNPMHQCMPGSLDTSCGLRETCFMANLADSYGDGWGGNKLFVTNDLTDTCERTSDSKRAVSPSFPSTPFRPPPVPLSNTRFSRAVCSTSCGVGEQSNTNDDGCELCSTDWYSDAEGGEFCSACR